MRSTLFWKNLLRGLITRSPTHRYLTEPLEHPRKIAAELARAAKILNDRLREIDGLYQLARGRGSVPQELLRYRRQA